MLGYRAGYPREEGYGSGTRLALLTWLILATWTSMGAVAVLAAVTINAARTADPLAP